MCRFSIILILVVTLLMNTFKIQVEGNETVATANELEGNVVTIVRGQNKENESSVIPSDAEGKVTGIPPIKDDLNVTISNNSTTNIMPLGSFVGNNTVIDNGTFGYKHVKQILSTIEHEYPRMGRRVTLGKTRKGNIILGMRVCKVQAGGTVLITAGVNSDEYFAVNFALYLINQLTQQSYNHEHLLFGLTYIIVPILNAAGNDNKNCYEHQRDAIRKFMKGVNNIKLYVDLHSGSSLVTIPFSRQAERMTANMNNVLEHHLQKSKNATGHLVLRDIDTQLVRWASKVRNITYSFYMSLQSDEPVDSCYFAAFEALKWATLQIQATDLDVQKSILKASQTDEFIVKEC